MLLTTSWRDRTVLRVGTVFATPVGWQRDDSFLRCNWYLLHARLAAAWMLPVEQRLASDSPATSALWWQRWWKGEHSQTKMGEGLLLSIHVWSLEHAGTIDTSFFRFDFYSAIIAVGSSNKIEEGMWIYCKTCNYRVLILNKYNSKDHHESCSKIK